MSRQRKRIWREASALGLTVDFIEWEPIRPGSEMEGLAGGWYVALDDGGYALGLNVDEVIAALRRRADYFAETATGDA